jgi:phytoene dehydrogenase-like protein
VSATYDVIALGGNLTTTLTAALLARRGLCVLLVPGKSSVLDGCLDLLSGFDRRMVRQVCHELGLTTFLERQLRRNNPPFQVVLPHCRLDVDQDDEALTEALARELSVPRHQVERLLVKVAGASRAMARLMAERETGERGLLELGNNNLWLEAVIRGPAIAISPFIEHNLVIARLWSTWRRGTFTLDGGVTALKLEAQKIMLEAGGEIATDTEPSGLLERGERLAGLVLEGRPNASAERFVLGVDDPGRLLSTLPGQRARLQRLPRTRVLARRYLLRLFFRRGWLPPSMGDHLLIYPETGPGLLQVLKDRSTRGDEEVLIVQTTVPTEMPPPRGQIIRAIRRLVPFFDDSFLHAASPHDEKRHRSIAMEPVFAAEEWSLSPAAADGSTDLILTPPVLLGGLGTEGAFAAALAAADQLA